MNPTPDPARAMVLFVNASADANPYSYLHPVTSADGRIALIINSGWEKVVFGYYPSHAEALQAFGKRIDRYKRLQPVAQHISRQLLKNGGFTNLPLSERINYFFSHWP